MSIISNQRTENIFEALEHYPKPPLISIDAFDAQKALEQEFVNKSQYAMFKAFIKLSGYEFNKKDFYNKIESIFRTKDKQSGALFAPVVSATIGLEDDKRNISPIERASALIISARNFYSDLITGRLVPDKFKDEILEMGQYPNCFSTTQIIDGKNVRLYKSKSVNKITVIIDGRYFLVDIGELKENIKFEDLANALNNLVKKSKTDMQGNDYHSPGILTCARNKTQIKMFNDVLKIKINEISYNQIKDSFLVLCLDLDQLPKDSSEAAKKAHIGNPKNRWYHTSLQIVVFGNSMADLVCNFSNSISGNVMMRLGEELFLRSSKIECNSKEIISNSVFEFDEMKWLISNEQIELAKKDIDLVLDNQPSTFVIKKVNKNILDSKNINAIPSFILALQKTIRDLVHNDLNITQFVSMSKFRCMDLTTTVVTTKEVIKFVDALDLNNYTNEEMSKLFQSAVTSQNEKIRNARKRFPVIEILQLYMNSLTGIKKIYNYIMFSILINYLNLSGYFKKSGREVIVSHPKISKGVNIVGRPGVRIPYAKHFGLHYQIFSEKIVITMMPGFNWKIQNEKFIEKIELNLNKIAEIT